MIVDTSALTAIFFGEPEAALYTRIIHDAENCAISVANFLELSIIIEAQIGADAVHQCDIFFRRADIIIEPFAIEQVHIAARPSMTSVKAAILRD